MIRPALIIFTVSTALFLSACESDQPQQSHKKAKFGYTGDTHTQVGPNPDQPQPPGTETTQQDNGGPIAPPPPTPPPPPAPDGNGGPAAPGNGGPKKDYPYATPVAGKPGFVTSPYAPYSGYVDVRGFPPGTEVKDPYTQKIFLVP